VHNIQTLVDFRCNHPIRLCIVVVSFFGSDGGEPLCSLNPSELPIPLFPDTVDIVRYCDGSSSDLMKLLSAEV